MKTVFYKKLISIFLLTITVGISMGMPLFLHECSHSGESDIHLFSAEHHCIETSCHSKDKTTKIEHFQDNGLILTQTPCCSFETEFINVENQLVSKSNIRFVQLFVFVQKFTFSEILSEIVQYFFHHKEPPVRLFGSSYRLAIQSILC